MPRISDVWRIRIYLIGLGLLSIIPVMLQRSLLQSRIYDIRWAGGLHPSDLLELRWIGGLAIYIPFLVLCGLVLSALRPVLAPRVLTFCVTVFLLFLLLFLFQAAVVIMLNVPPPHT